MRKKWKNYQRHPKNFYNGQTAFQYWNFQTPKLLKKTLKKTFDQKNLKKTTQPSAGVDKPTLIRDI